MKIQGTQAFHATRHEDCQRKHLYSLTTVNVSFIVVRIFEAIDRGLTRLMATPVKTEVVDVLNNDLKCNNLKDCPISSDGDTVGGLLENVPVICGVDNSLKCHTYNDNTWTLLSHLYTRRDRAASVVLNNNALWITGGLFLIFRWYHKKAFILQVDMATVVITNQPSLSH